MKCVQIKANGEECQANAMDNCDYCVMHNPNITAETKKEIQRKGGENRAIMVGEVVGEEVRIESTKDVVKLMENTINRVRQGRLDARVANTIGYLAGITLKALEQEDIAERLKAIENSLT